MTWQNVAAEAVASGVVGLSIRCTQYTSCLAHRWSILSNVIFMSRWSHCIFSTFYSNSSAFVLLKSSMSSGSRHVQVDVLEYYDQAIRSSRQEFPLPAVLRVKVYIRKQAKRESITLTRRNLLMRDKHTCQYALPPKFCAYHLS